MKYLGFIISFIFSISIFSQDRYLSDLYIKIGYSDLQKMDSKINTELPNLYYYYFDHPIYLNNHKIDQAVSIMQDYLSGKKNKPIHLYIQTNTDFILDNSMTPSYILENHPLNNITNMELLGFELKLSNEQMQLNLNEMTTLTANQGNGSFTGKVLDALDWLNVSYTPSNPVIKHVSLFGGEDNFLCNLVNINEIDQRDIIDDLSLCEVKTVNYEFVYTCTEGKKISKTLNLTAYSKSHEYYLIHDLKEYEYSMIYDKETDDECFFSKAIRK